jgi:hypothetical protein
LFPLSPWPLALADASAAIMPHAVEDQSCHALATLNSTEARNLATCWHALGLHTGSIRLGEIKAAVVVSQEQ